MKFTAGLLFCIQLSGIYKDDFMSERIKGVDEAYLMEDEEKIEETVLVEMSTTKTEQTENKNTTEQAPTQKPSFEGNGFEKLFELFSAAGVFFSHVIVQAIMLPFKLLGAVSRFIWKHTIIFRETMKRLLKSFGLYVAGPFLRTKRALSITKTKLQQAKKEGKAFSMYFKVISEAIFGKRGILVSLFNYAAPIVAICFLFSVVSYATNTSYGIKLTVNGQFLGYIQSEQVFTDAEMLMQERITYMDNDHDVIEMVPEFSIEMLGDQDFTTKFQLVNKMMEISDVPIEYAYGMYIGDKFYGALVDTANVEKALEQLLQKYATNASGEDVAFEKEISYEPGLYISDSIVDEKEIIELLNSNKTEASYYTVQEGDSLPAISDKTGFSSKELTELNPQIANDDYVFRTGAKILITREVPFLSVSVSRTEVYEVEVPYETEYTTNDTTYQGVLTTVQVGEPGVNQITAKVYYVNGKEVRRTIIATRRIKNPVNEIISEGTLPPQSSHVSTDSVDIGKMFIWPVPTGELCEWGWWDGGYTGHTGVDISASYGDDVYAGASGTVIFSGWDNGGYGYCVIIQHGEEYGYLRTLYAHNSQLYLTEGQQVVQGQCIGAIGETGRAYGPHCHFEVRNGSERLNPRYYLSGLPPL